MWSNLIGRPFFGPQDAVMLIQILSFKIQFKVGRHFLNDGDYNSRDLFKIIIS